MAVGRWVSERAPLGGERGSGVFAVHFNCHHSQRSPAVDLGRCLADDAVGQGIDPDEARRA